MCTIESSIIIDKKSQSKAFYKETNKIQLSCHSLTDIRSLENIIHKVESFEIYKNENVIPHPPLGFNKWITLFMISLMLLKHQTWLISNPRIILWKSVLIFVDQLKYLIVDKHARRYNILTLVFCLKIHGISPACYRLIQASNCVILPHESKLLIIKNNIGLESEYTKILAEDASAINDLER